MAPSTLNQNQVDCCILCSYKNCLSAGCDLIKDTSSLICYPGDMLVLRVPLPGHTEPQVCWTHVSDFLAPSGAQGVAISVHLSVSDELSREHNLCLSISGLNIQAAHPSLIPALSQASLCKSIDILKSFKNDFFYVSGKLIEEESLWSSSRNEDILENWSKWKLYLLQDSGETVVVQPDMQISISNLVKMKWVSFYFS